MASVPAKAGVSSAGKPRHLCVRSIQVAATKTGVSSGHLVESRHVETRRMREEAANHRLEGFKRHRLEVRVERNLIVPGAEIDPGPITRMSPVAVAQISVPAMMAIVVPSLKKTVMLHHPECPLAYVGLQDARRHFGVVEGRNAVGDIVKQRCDHRFLVLVVPIGASRRLQGVLETADALSHIDIVSVRFSIASNSPASKECARAIAASTMR